MKKLNTCQIICLTVQVISVIMILFFGWLSTKMELPDGIGTYWFWVNVIAFLGYVISRIFKKSY